MKTGDKFLYGRFYLFQLKEIAWNITVTIYGRLHRSYLQPCPPPTPNPLLMIPLRQQYVLSLLFDHLSPIPIPTTLPFPYNSFP